MSVPSPGSPTYRGRAIDVLRAMESDGKAKRVWVPNPDNNVDGGHVEWEVSL